MHMMGWENIFHPLGKGELLPMTVKKQLPIALSTSVEPLLGMETMTRPLASLQCLFMSRDQSSTPWSSPATTKQSSFQLYQASRSSCAETWTFGQCKGGSADLQLAHLIELGLYGYCENKKRNCSLLLIAGLPVLEQEILLKHESVNMGNARTTSCQSGCA